MSSINPLTPMIYIPNSTGQLIPVYRAIELPYSENQPRPQVAPLSAERITSIHPAIEQALPIGKEILGSNKDRNCAELPIQNSLSSQPEKIRLATSTPIESPSPSLVRVNPQALPEVSSTKQNRFKGEGYGIWRASTKRGTFLVRVGGLRSCGKSPDSRIPTAYNGTICKINPRECSPDTCPHYGVKGLGTRCIRVSPVKLQPIPGKSLPLPITTSYMSLEVYLKMKGKSTPSEERSNPLHPTFDQTEAAQILASLNGQRNRAGSVALESREALNHRAEILNAPFRTENATPIQFHARNSSSIVPHAHLIEPIDVDSSDSESTITNPEPSAEYIPVVAPKRNKRIAQPNAKSAQAPPTNSTNSAVPKRDKPDFKHGIWKYQSILYGLVYVGVIKIRPDGKRTSYDAKICKVDPNSCSPDECPHFTPSGLGFISLRVAPSYLVEIPGKSKPLPITSRYVHGDWNKK